ncbi:MAG: hypothetical protein J0L84_02220 [Verrucomicrobia bacterium]|nr:hypothetical protein [Verrucomicrobiota bacterium]
MTVTVPRRWNWRWLRSPLAIALLISIALHLYAWLMAHLIGMALRNGWLPAWMHPVVAPVAALITPPPSTAPPSATEPAWEEIPLQFVEVDPMTVTAEVPPQTPFYSTAATVAANPDPPKVDQEKPRIDGKRENTLKTFDTTQPSKTPPPPAPQEIVQAPEPQPAAPEPKPAPPEPLVVREVAPVTPPTPPEARREAPEPLEVPKKSPPPGETLLAKVSPAPVDFTVREPMEPVAPLIPQAAEKMPEPAKKAPRPKTLAAARAAKGAIVGERMRQEGGVARSALQSSLNVKASPLGDYNYRMVLAVQDQWYRLLEEQHFALDRQGQVVVTFNLFSDGTIKDIQIKETNVGDTLSFLCELSVMRPAPFGKWPPDVRRLIGGDTVPVTFTFNYY